MFFVKWFPKRGLLTGKLCCLAALLITALALHIPSASAQAPEGSDTFQLDEDERAAFREMQQQLITDLQAAFQESPVQQSLLPSLDSAKNGKKSRKKKKKKKKKPCAKNAFLAPASAPEIAFQGSNCIQACAFTAAWARASCYATACAECSNGYRFCASGSAYAYSYSSAYYCTELCRSREIGIPCDS